MLICFGVYNAFVCPKVDILYPRTTPKLYNKKYKKVIKMECPYLSVTQKAKICSLMVEQGLDGKIDDFDITHYCKGTQNHCYFYRSFGVQKPVAEHLEESKPEKIQVAFCDEPSMLRLEEPETSVDHDELHPLPSKLVKRGLCYKVKPELVDKLISRLRRK